MHCRIVDIRGKEVIDICTGVRLGFPIDVEVNVDSGRLVAIIVPGPCRYFGLFGREEDIVIPWDCIRRIGDDLILVERK
ncbi:MAG: YlmC/YmxH family sporulation protein [Oscillospiraceae bacterium]|jgi:YlmC/YmxH family sporulation protein|nr:YlmC/YmxH family sporulation protein [Oscillospiraceae bacterium]